MAKLTITLEDSQVFLLKQWAETKKCSVSKVLRDILKDAMQNYSLQYAYDSFRAEMSGLRELLESIKQERANE